VDVRGVCVYRGKNGTKCAVGCLITDEEYKREMEGNDVTALNRLGLLPERLIPHLELLSEMQAVHDSFGTSRWEFWFATITQRLNPVYTPA